MVFRFSVNYLITWIFSGTQITKQSASTIKIIANACKSHVRTFISILFTFNNMVIVAGEREKIAIG